MRAEIERLDAECTVLREENGAAQGLKKEVAGMKDRIREAAELEEQNAKLGNAILELRQELANAEAEVIDLHSGILTVASNHSKKSRRSVG